MTEELRKSFEQDKTVDKSLLIFDFPTPHCKVHGAMMCLNGIWRCYGTYKGSPDNYHPPQQSKPYSKFIERTCNCAILNDEWNKLKEKK